MKRLKSSVGVVAPAASCADSLLVARAGSGRRSRARLRVLLDRLENPPAVLAARSRSALVSPNRAADALKIELIENTEPVLPDGRH